MEGIMMRNKDNYSVAVRKYDGSIEVKTDVYKGVLSRYKVTRLPFIRGIFSFIDSLVLGMKSLNFSAEAFAEEAEPEEPSRFEKWLEAKFGDKTEKVIMNAVTVLAVVLAVFIFMILPAWLVNLAKPLIGNGFLMALLEGILRIASSSERRAKSAPVMELSSKVSVSFHRVAWRAISMAVRELSPVTIFTAIPALSHLATACGTSSLTGSSMAMKPS